MRELGSVITSYSIHYTKLYEVDICGDENFAVGTVVKDGGDDPDITNGIEICAKVSRRSDCKIMIYGGVITSYSIHYTKLYEIVH